jgi:putative endonuclease
MYYFYVLQSELDNKFYYGSTNDLKRRLLEHQNKEVTATKYRNPLKLIYYEAYLTLEQARHREQQVKRSGSIRKALLARIEQ